MLGKADFMKRKTRRVSQRFAMHGTLMVLSQCRRNYTPVSVSTASGYAGVPPAYVVCCPVCIKQAGRLRTGRYRSRY